MRSLNAISTRNLIRRKGRYGLVAFGTCLGVALVFAVLVSSAATTRALDRELQGSAGRADVAVSPLGAFDAVLPAGIDARLRSMPGVSRISPSFGMRSEAQVPASSGRGVGADQIVFVTGLDRAAAAGVDEIAVVSGRLAEDGPRPGPVEVALPVSQAKSLGVGIGSRMTLATPGGRIPAVVVGLLGNRGVGLSAGGAVAYTTLASAQSMADRPGALTGVAVVLAPGTTRRHWIDSARTALGPGVALTDTRDLAAGFKGFLAAINGAMTVVAAIALFVGGFLIFLTFSVAVAERTRIYGTLRALGALGRQVRRLVVVEAAAIALAAAAVGVVLGYGLAIATVPFTGHLLRLQIGHVAFSWGGAVASVLLALVVAVAAAWLPARRAAAVRPVAAMRDGSVEPERPARPWIGLAFLGAGVLFSAVPTPPLVRAAAQLSVLLGAVLIVPWLLRPAARLLGKASGRLSPGVGDIAVMHLVKERSRSAYTLALVMVVLAMILSVGASNQAMRHTLSQVIDREVGGGHDIQIFAPGAFDPSVGSELARVPGVAADTPIRFGTAEVVGRADRQLALEVVDPATYFGVASFAWVNGSDARARAAMVAGGAVLLPDVVAANLGVPRGGRVDLRTTAGVRSFTVAGTFATIGSNNNLVASTADLALLGTGRPNGFIARLASRADPDRVRLAVVSRLGPRYQVEVTTSAAVKTAAEHQVAGFFSIVYALLAVAALIGMLGLANTLVVSVLARTREVGILRSAGAVRRQIRGMVLVEAETLALTAFLLALPLSAVLAAAVIRGQRASLGFSLRFVYPWSLLAPVGVACVLVAAAAAILPARRAGRLAPVEAVRME